MTRIISVAFLLALSACQSEVIDNTVAPPTGPVVSFSESVLPLLTSSCGGSGCHVGESFSGVRLDSFGAIRSSLGAQYGVVVVQPSDVAGSPIVDKISTSTPEFGVRMPFGRAPLSGEQIGIIRTWIEEGAKDN